MRSRAGSAVRATLAASGIALACAASAAQADAAYPAKPVRVIAPFPAGGGVDFVARSIAERFGQAFGQTFVVDNRAGAGSTIGMGIAAKAAADGHTLVVASNGMTVSAELYPGLPYDVTKDFAPIALIASSPNVLVVPPSVKFASVRDLIDAAKARPKAINYGSGGVGGSTHLCTDYFLSVAGIQATHVAYKGTPPALTDLVAGNVQFMMSPIAPAIPLISSGRLRALGVTSPRRTALLPEVPAIAESGLPGFAYASWYALLAPAGTPAPVVATLNAALKKALDAPQVRERLRMQGLEADWTTPEGLAGRIRADMDKWVPILRKSRPGA